MQFPFDFYRTMIRHTQQQTMRKIEKRESSQDGQKIRML